MALPTFDGFTLLDKAERMRTQGAISRHALEQMPGVNGAYAQTHGMSEQMFEISGVKEAGPLTTNAASLALLRAAVRSARELYVNTVADFVDTSGVTWTNCLLAEYSLQPPFYFRTTTAPSSNIMCGGFVHLVIISLEGTP